METDKVIKNPKERLEYWDNLKGILIFLVVVGHFFYEFKSKNNTIYNMAVFIFLFHMPAFVFVSGYFCKDTVDFSKIKKYLVFYFIGNTFMMLFSYIYMKSPITLLEPYYSFWYLIALIVWRLTNKYFKNIKGILPITIVISLLIGFFSQINNTLALSRIICFFPFIILGIKLYEKEIYHKIEEYKPLLKIISVVLLGYLLLFLSEIASKVNFNDLLMYPYIEDADIIKRIVIYVIAFLMIFVLLAMTPKKKKIFLTKIGMNSLYIYMYHRIFTMIIPRFWNYPGNTALTIGLSFVCSVIICLIFGSNTAKNITEKAYSRLINTQSKASIIK